MGNTSGGVQSITEVGMCNLKMHSVCNFEREKLLQANSLQSDGNSILTNNTNFKFHDSPFDKFVTRHILYALKYTLRFNKMSTIHYL